MIFILLLSFVTSIAGLNCSDGMNYSSTLTTKTIGATLPQFLSIVGSFFNDTWYNYPVKSTVGPDNQVGSIRTITDATSTLVFHETLIIYQLNASFFEQSWQGPGDNVTSDDFGNFVLGSYVEHLTGESTCDGSAVLVNFGIEFCATNLSTAISVLTDGHIQGIQQVETLLGIKSFTICGAVLNSIRSSSLLIGALIITLGSL